MRFLIFCLFGSILLTSCEREIDIDLKKEDGRQIVIEGAIELNEKPRILITRSRGFFDAFPADTSAFFEEFLVGDAVVTLSDGNTTENCFLTFDNQYPFVFYTTPSMKGEVGKTYTLRVEADGKVITASSYLPPPIPLDSAFFRLNIFDINEDSLGFLFTRLSDPDTLGNAYRLFTKLHTSPSYSAPNGGVFDDRFINGTTFDFFTGRKSQPFQFDTSATRFFYKLGDTIQIKFTTIGLPEARFFQTLENASANVGNPFAAPVMVQSNIKGGFGVWCAYGTSFKTIVASN